MRKYIQFVRVVCLALSTFIVTSGATFVLWIVFNGFFTPSSEPPTWLSGGAFIVALVVIPGIIGRVSPYMWIVAIPPLGNYFGMILWHLVFGSGGLSALTYDSGWASVVMGFAAFAGAAIIAFVFGHSFRYPLPERYKRPPYL